MAESLPESGAGGADSRNGRLVLRAVLARLRLLALLGGALALAACWRDVLAQIQRWSAPAAPDLANLPVEYFCPMHPGVTSSSPGRCPACAMPLSRASALSLMSAGRRSTRAGKSTDRSATTRPSTWSGSSPTFET